MKMLILTAILTLYSWTSYAQGWKYSYGDYYEPQYNHLSFWDHIEERQCQQTDRISNGIERGQLTRREQKQLRREQKHLAKHIRQIKRRRFLNSSNKSDLIEHLNYVSGQIRQFKHNDQLAYRRRHDHLSHNAFTYREGNNRNNSVGLYFRF